MALQFLITAKIQVGKMCTSLIIKGLVLRITWYNLLKLNFIHLWSRASVLIHLVAYYSSPLWLAVFPLLVKSCNKVYFCIIKITVVDFLFLVTTGEGLSVSEAMVVILLAVTLH